MLFDRRRSRWTAAVLLLAAGLVGCDQPIETPLEPELGLLGHRGVRDRALEVYTQNVYLGGDTGPLLSIDFTDIVAVLTATNVFWGQVQASNVPERVVEIVDELDRRRPHLVGLQEVLQFVLKDGTLQEISRLDLLELIEAEIAARGLPYEAVATQEATSSMLPLAPGGTGISVWLEFTDRIVTLRRTDVEVTQTDQGLYGAVFDLGAVVLKRGWTRTTVRHLNTPHHFINTHLEIGQLAPIQVAQAAELQNVVVDGLDGVTVIVGDLNSNAAAPLGDPSRTETYDNLIADGFIDVWDVAPHRRSNEGLTCCHPQDLVGEQEFDQRIDFILARAANDDDGRWQRRRGLFRADIVGEEAADLTASGLWPSDHAGIVAKLRLPWRLR